MRVAFIRHPMAFALHALGLVALMVVHRQFEMPLLVTIVSVLLLALWPWLGPWQRRDDEVRAADDAAPSLSRLTQNLSEHTCHNALSAAQVADSVKRLAEKVQSQLLATEQISQSAEAITHT